MTAAAANAAVTVDDHDETSVSGLWDTARWFLRWLIGVCGTPCALVAEVRLSPKERREIAFWLRPVEAVVRRLLVVEAVRIAQTLVKEKGCPGKKTGKRLHARPRFCRVAFPDPEDSTRWPVRFALLEPSAVRRPAAQKGDFPRVRDLETNADVLAPARLALDAAEHRLAMPHGGAAPTDDALLDRTVLRPKLSRAAGNPWPLAKRVEAVMRVLVNPGPYARRLARRLRKDAARIAATCRLPPRRPGERPPYGDQPLRHASDHALQALAAFDTS